jgi:ADP-heptose:LPS heptosyltransferase
MARRFLFVLRTKLGDTLVHFQTVRAFAARHPADEVVVVTRANYAPLLEGTPGVRIIPFRNRAEMVAKLLWLRLTRPSFDALVVLIGYGPAMLQIARLVRARRRLFFDARFPDAYPEYPAPYDETSIVDRSWRTACLLDPHLPRPDRLELPALRARRLATPARARAIGIVPLRTGWRATSTHRRWLSSSRACEPCIRARRCGSSTRRPRRCRTGPASVATVGARFPKLGELVTPASRRWYGLTLGPTNWRSR